MLWGLRFPKYQEVRVVLASVNLPQDSAYSGSVLSYNDKQVFDNEAYLCKLVDDLDVGQSLFVCTYLILAFDDEDTCRLDDSECFSRTGKIQVEHSLVIFLRVVICPVVVVVGLKVLVVLMCSPARRVHVRRVEHHAVHGSAFVRKLSAVNSVTNVGGL